MCWEALTMAKYFWFAGSDVLQWIAQRLWISNLGESPSGTPATRTAVGAGPPENLWRVETKRRLNLGL